MKHVSRTTFQRRQRSDAQWLAALRDVGPAQREALTELHALLLQAVLLFLRRHRDELRDMGREALLQFAERCAVEALETVVARLDTFHGEARFTLWASRFAVVQAANRLRDAKQVGEMPMLAGRNGLQRLPRLQRLEIAPG